MKVLCVLGIVLLLTGTITAYGQKKLPAATVENLEGQPVDLSSFTSSGKTIIISMWATWCAPCKKELDVIAGVYEEWKEKYNVELIAITIDTQQQLAKVKPMAASKGWTYTILVDTNHHLRQSLNIVSIPQTYIVNSRGHIVYEHTGYSPGDERQLEEHLRKLTSE